MKVPFNKALFNLTRLEIVGTLQGEPPIPFKELTAVCKLTDGNLASHLRTLEKHGLIRIHKRFNNKKPQTLVELTSKGDEQLDKLREWFYQTFIEGGLP